MRKTLLPLALPAVVGAAVGGAFLLAPRREYADPRHLPGVGSFINVAGYDLHYTDEGPRDGPVVLLIHGFGSWAFSWRNERALLAGAGFRVLAIDLLGSGASARPAAPVYTTDMQAALLLGVLDTLGVERAHLVGHSFGARVAIQVALMAPELVCSLALISAEAFATERPPVARLLQMPGIGYALAFYTTAPALVRTGLKLVTKRHEWLSDDVVAGYAAPMYVKGAAAAQVWQGRSPKDGAQSVPEHLRAIRQPALIIWGGDDPVFPAADGHKLATALPNAELRVLPGVGHVPHEEAADEVANELLEFLKVQAS